MGRDLELEGIFWKFGLLGFTVPLVGRYLIGAISSDTHDSEAWIGRTMLSPS